jgi:hypothetical protein
VEFSVEFFVELLANKKVRNREGMGEKTIVPLMLLGKKQNREGVGEKTTIPLMLLGGKKKKNRGNGREDNCSEPFASRSTSIGSLPRLTNSRTCSWTWSHGWSVDLVD